MFARMTILAAAILVSGYAVAQQPQTQTQQPRLQQPEATQNQPKPADCWDTHTNQVRERTAADPQANDANSTVGAAKPNAPANSQNTRPSGNAQRPAGMANC